MKADLRRYGRPTALTFLTLCLSAATILGIVGCGGGSAGIGSSADSQTSGRATGNLGADSPGTTTPLLSSWFTENSGLYARVVQTTGGKMTDTWPTGGLPNMGGGQAKPAYSDIQQVSYSASYTYIKGTGLASHQMGPWYDSMGAIFGNWPSNQHYIHRFPNHPQVAAAKTTNSLGALGLWVNGVALFNLLDGFHYDTASKTDVSGPPGQTTTGIWFRNAVVVESPTFDKSNAHQPPSGTYHYHDNPVALRYQLGDNVTRDSSGNYHEKTTGLHHSPILGWSDDGYPIYGPYGYSDPNSAASGVRRMVSGFTIRNGKMGTTDLLTAGRHTLGKWAAELHSTGTTLASTEYGPNVSSQYTLGRYVEDFDFLGDHGYKQGKDFDLDVYNGRKCVTPEFPNGTYAYFVTLNADGSPAFPYVIGRQWYGTPSGGAVQSISESVKVYVDAGPNSAIHTTLNGTKLTWSSVEGGHYRVDGSTNGTTWVKLVSDVASQGLSTSYTLASLGSYKQFRAVLTALDPYDNTAFGSGGGTGGGGGTIATVVPNSATHGATVTVKMTLSGNMVPPAMISPNSAMIGAIDANSESWDGKTATATFAIPSSATRGAQTISVSFPPPPGSSQNVVFSLTNGFTIK